MVAVGFQGAAVAGSDTELAVDSIEGMSEDSEFSVFNYATNQGTFATVETDGLLVAIYDWRQGDIDTSELLDVITAWRAGDDLLEIQFDDQDSIDRDAVVIDTAVVTEAVDDEFIVAVEDEDGTVLSDSDVLSGAQSDVEIDGLDLNATVGEGEANLTAVLHEVDDGDRGDAFLAEGAPITDTALVDADEEEPTGEFRDFEDLDDVTFTQGDSVSLSDEEGIGEIELADPDDLVDNIVNFVGVDDGGDDITEDVIDEATFDIEAENEAGDSVSGFFDADDASDYTADAAGPVTVTELSFDIEEDATTGTFDVVFTMFDADEQDDAEDAIEFDATRSVTIEEPEVDRVKIDPGEDQTIEAGETVEFSATAFDEDDNVLGR